MVLFILSATSSQVAYSLGLGEVQLNSYIGEKLSASIPALSIVDANSVSVEITPQNDVSLQSYLENRNGQTTIRIISDESINEPYVQFSLKVTDQSQVIVREFTALLDIKQNDSFTRGNVIATIPYETQQITSDQTSAGVVYSDTLGPYDWAQKGNIPSRFGPVLDGQSLWRVARRINSAMGVSLDQMMWALYSNNPDAFSSNAIESLLAGVYLDIPSLSLVSNTSNLQAKDNLNNVSTNKLTAIVNTNDGAVIGEVTGLTEDAPVSNTDTGDTVSDDQGLEPVEEDSNLVDDEFKLTGLNEINDLGDGDNQNSNEQAIETINVLSVTVGNLTQELIRKDKRIEFLEDKIVALEKVAEIDSNSTGISTVLAEPVATPAVTPLETVETADASIATNATNTNRFSLKPWMLWLGLLLIALMGIFFFRNKFKRLNLFGSVDDIDFPTQMEYTVENTEPKQVRDFSQLPTVKNAEIPPNKKVDIDHDSFIDISIQYYDENSENETQHEVGTKLKVEDDVEDLNQADFEAKLESLNHEKNHTGVANLLEFARNKVIDDDRYYFEYLRHYFHSKDEDKFYAFYDEIEYAIQHFPEDWNRQISEMVIELGQNA